MTTKSAQVKAIIEARYPCSIMPYGAQLAIANEVGVSRELVRKVADSLGAAPIRTHSQRKHCGSCGVPLRYGAKGVFCRACRWVTIPCHACGEPVRRLASNLATRMKSVHRAPNGTLTQYKGRVFCNRTCFGNWQVRNFGWGTPYQESMTDAEREELRAHA